MGATGEGILSDQRPAALSVRAVWLTGDFAAAAAPARRLSIGHQKRALGQRVPGQRVSGPVSRPADVGPEDHPVG